MSSPSPSLPTPYTTHVARPEYRSVYEPAEDTFLLLDALEQDRDELRSMAPAVCMEVGSGSGCVATFLGQLLEGARPCIWATDINPAANRCTLETGRVNGVRAGLEAVQTSLARGLAGRMRGMVDVLVFNPPYVVTVSEEVVRPPAPGNGRDLAAAAWAGGVDGREVVDEFWPDVDTLLSPGGVFYLVAIAENRPLEIIGYLASRFGLAGSVALSRKAGCEHLCVLKFRRHGALAA
ncbi:HemK methyltransferase member 2 [Spiromyces aspiralis]|uniref:HemK methyltransferase member 2 n=1 Tax=Spiromyces aspiralis TaxID=68401 RepID=A0ACC1HAK2_9FUNG|nr:HemK methyltransferase member 2 [Spiromyces aspiralis]